MKKTITLILLCLSLQLNAKMLSQKKENLPSIIDLNNALKPKKDLPSIDDLNNALKSKKDLPSINDFNAALISNGNNPQPVLYAQLNPNTSTQVKPTYVIDWNKVWTITLWIAGIGLLVLGFFKRKYIANRISIKWTLAGMAIIATFFLVTNPSQSDFEKYVKYQIGNDMVRDKKKGELFTTRTSYCLVYSVYEYKYFSGSQLVKHGTYYGFLKTFK